MYLHVQHLRVSSATCVVFVLLCFFSPLNSFYEHGIYSDRC
ncbi:unnamed protein product [Amoebophrya sp. A25]|nr:unnamed protein product [Amoebophrya sp. A25]|eukprot:GSA25T00024537001.1